MPYNFVPDSSHTKTHRSRLSSSEVRFYNENDSFAFLSPFTGLRSPFTGLIGKLSLFRGLRGNLRWSS